MKISIAMATYNGAKYIEEQLLSFINQTRQPDELIINDDCSTDNTESICKDFASKSNFKVVFCQNEQNLGYAGNFNAAIMKTTGDLVFLSDQDDVWFPEKIEFIEQVAKTNPEMLVIMNNALLTDNQLKETSFTKLEQIYASGGSDRNFVMGSCAAIRRELLELCMPIPEGFKSHDGWIVNTAHDMSKKLIIKKVLQYYRRHESNESTILANRIVKIKKWHIFFNKMKSKYKSYKTDYDDDSLIQRDLYLKHLNILINHTDNKSNHLLKQKHRELQEQVDFMRTRFMIRSKPTYQRVAVVLKLLAAGKYRGFSGTTDALRDLIG